MSPHHSFCSMLYSVCKLPFKVMYFTDIKRFKALQRALKRLKEKKLIQWARTLRHFLNSITCSFILYIIFSFFAIFRIFAVL
jgi:hypothetical protein